MSDTRSTKSTRQDAPSGRFVVRIDPGLHALLREAARHAGVSLNDYCAGKLALPGTPVGPAADVVGRAASMFGDALAGVIAFGSWARAEQAVSSDVDVLVVVGPKVTVTREHYRRWDAEPIRWGARAVDAHFLRLPAAGERVTGIWAEAAVDGVVLFDPDLDLSRRLVEIRRRIVAGEIVRRSVHGQPYWVDAA
jgi:hypothetical protein